MTDTRPKRAKHKPAVQKMTADELMDAHRSYCYSAGDDFSLRPLSDADHRHGTALGREVLRRLKAYDAILVTETENTTLVSLLARRDRFISSQGKWPEFVAYASEN